MGRKKTLTHKTVITANTDDGTVSHLSTRSQMTDGGAHDRDRQRMGDTRHCINNRNGGATSSRILQPLGDIPRMNIETLSFRTEEEGITLNEDHDPTEWFHATSPEERGRKFLFVIGDGGCGKTYKMRNLQHDFEFNSKPPFRGVKIVLWCNFREVSAVFSREDRLDILDFIRFLKPAYYRMSRKHLTKIIQTKERNILLLMDGLEDFNFPLNNDLPNCNFDDKVPINVLLKTILSCKLLRKARKIISARPSQMSKLKGDMKPDRTTIYNPKKGSVLYDLLSKLAGDYSEEVLDIVRNVPMFAEIACLPTLCIFLVNNLIEFITEIEVAVVPNVIRELYPDRMLRMFPMFQDQEADDVIEMRNKASIAFKNQPLPNRS